MNDYFTFFYVKHFELPMCMKCAIQINLPCLALPNVVIFIYFYRTFFSAYPNVKGILQFFSVALVHFSNRP